MPSLCYSFASQETCFQVRRRPEPYAEPESALHATVNGESKISEAKQERLVIATSYKLILFCVQATLR